LTSSNPTLVDLKLPDLSAYLGQEGGDSYAPHPRGLPSAREALCAHLKGRADVQADRVFLTASTSEAYSFLLGTLCDPGDAIAVPEPSYPLLDQLAQIAQVEPVPYRVRYDGAWHVDTASLPTRDTIEKRKIRAVVGVSPNNPTGNFLSAGELSSLAALGLPLIVDEVFRSYRHEAQRSDESPADPLALSELTAPLVILDGLSKRLGGPGLKLSWMVIQGPGAEHLVDRLDWYGDTFLSVGAAVQLALPHLLSMEDRVQRLIGERLNANLEQARNITLDSGLTMLDCAGGWSLVLRLPTLSDESVMWRTLAENGVWIQPGHLYQLPFESSVVVSLLTPPLQFRAGLERMRSLFGSSPPTK
jgi:aspartate/methionine/tyrosine aminotransferase